MLHTGHTCISISWAARIVVQWKLGLQERTTLSNPTLCKNLLEKLTLCSLVPEILLAYHKQSYITLGGQQSGPPFQYTNINLIWVSKYSTSLVCISHFFVGTNSPGTFILYLRTVVIKLIFNIMKCNLVIKYTYSSIFYSSLGLLLNLC